MLLETFVVGLIPCNCTIVADPATQRAIVVDPGGDLQTIQSRLAKNQLTLELILLTHAHIDHVAACKPLQRETHAPARLHHADRFLAQMVGVQAAMLGLPIPEAPELASDLEDEETISLGAIRIKVLHTPGHSPGSVSFLLRSDNQQVLLSGDTLFRRGVGRTDLWAGDQASLVRSIQTRLYTLDDAIQVIPGHGDSTTLGEEKSSNPFVRAKA